MSTTTTTTSTEHYPWCSDEKISALSRESYGRELSTKVAAALISGKRIMNLHRDYCGLALLYDYSNGFVLGYCYDGDSIDEIERFSSEEAFVEFLEKQSDFTLSGADESAGKLYEPSPFQRNNQRINRAMLENL